jgi:ABC-2 type transport system permease protein
MKLNPLQMTLAVAWKDLQVIFKDRGLLIVIIGLPLVFSVFNGFVNQNLSSSGEGVTFPVAVVNLDQDIYGDQIASILESIDVLDVTTLDSLAAAEQHVLDSKALAAIMIPAGLTQNIKDYQSSEIEVIVDTTQQQFASIVASLMKDVVGPVIVQGEISYAIRTLLSEIPEFQQADPQTQNALAMQNFGVQMAQVQKMISDPWVKIETKIFEDEETVVIPDNIFAMIVPSFVVMFAFFIVGAMSAELLKERQEGTLRRLIAAPLHRWTIIAGKMLAYIGLVLIQVAIIFGVANLFFDMPVGNSLTGLLAVSLALGLTATALGMLVASLAKTDKQADSTGILLGFVLAAVGGCFMIGTPVPLYQQGGMVQTISRLIPHAHALIAYGKLINQNAGLLDVLPQIGLLMVYTLAFFAIAVWRFRFE